MSADEANYTIEISDFAKRHFIKKFEKKYGLRWQFTEEAIKQLAIRIDQVVEQTDRAETIKVSRHFKIVKLSFKIAGINESAKSSGNRVILFVNEELHECQILLVYSKNEIGPPNETSAWQGVIKENFPDL